MTIKFAGHKSVAEAARITGGYPELVRSLCATYAIPIVQRGRYSWIADGDVIELSWRVEQWLHRPRLSRPVPPPGRVPRGVRRMIAEQTASN